MNGQNGQNGQKNGSSTNGATDRRSLLTISGDSEIQTKTTPTTRLPQQRFDQPVILQQSNFWSRAIVWGIVGVTTFGVIWASVAKIEEAVPATGQLKPLNHVQEVKAPVGGVVQEIFVQDGQRVKKGDLLLRLDPTAAEAQRRSLEQIITSFKQQNQFYRSQLSGSSATARPTNIPPQLQALAENRAALVAENQLYQAQLGGSTRNLNLSPDQVTRLQAGLAESQSREAAARLDISQLQQQLAQAQGQLDAARSTLAIDEKIYSDLRPLLDDGGISRIQVVKQEQQVIQGHSDVNRYSQEVNRLQYAIAQAQEKYQNTQALSRTDLLNKVADNNKKIADIDTQLNKAIIDNENQIAQNESQLSQAEVTLRYQELRAPVDGVVFDLQAKGAGYVANSTEPVLKVVPGNALIAEVYITNQDIGFVKEGMTADVRVDSFPFSEFGDIHGKITGIGSDALPPDQVHPFYRFPARVELDQQFLAVNGKQVPLQSGMSITTNIITRKRSVLSIFTDLFSRKIDSLKTVR